MARPVEVRPLAPYRIWLRYQDGTEGEVDLSHLAGKGVFAAWDTEGVFARVRLGPHGQIEWPGEIDLCPDALYLKLTGKRPEDVFTGPARPAGMREVSRFYGIVIRIFYDDHNPPHFHAEYGEHEVLVNINTLAILSGSLPARALGMVTEWASLHQRELLVSWERASRLQPPGKIAPLP